MMTEKLPHVLVISHTCFSADNSMGSTLASYFGTYNNQCVAQLYIKEMQPNIHVCENYFKITDEDILSKLKHPWKKSVGSVIAIKPNEDISAFLARSDEHASGNRALKMLCRDLVWKTGAWNNHKLHQWIRSFQPDVILCQPGDFPYLLTMAVKLAKKYHVPIMIHQSETYYLKPMQATDLAYRIYRKVYKKAYERMMRYTSAAVYLCDAIKRDYDAVFKVPSYCIMKSTDIEPHIKKVHEPEKYKFLYAGNVGEKVGRDRPLVEIGRALKQLGYHLDVYTASRGEHIKDFTEENGIVLHDAVPYAVLQGIIEESDFIIHTESQKEENVIDLKYAFTTKIADMLASGCCPIVYGTTEIASIAYFKETGTACVIEEKDSLVADISALLQNKNQIDSIVRKAYHQAKTQHNPIVNSQKFAEVIQTVSKERII